MSEGEPTALVGDDGVEGQDPPPDGPFVVAPVLLESETRANGDDLRRADEQSPEKDQEILRVRMMAAYGRLNPF